MPGERGDRAFTRRDGRIFAFTLAGGFLFLALIFRARDLPTATLVAGYAAAAAFVAGIVIPGQLGLARRAWMKLGDAIGKVTTPILMAIVYYLLFTPLGLARRKLARKPLSSGDTYWIQREPLPKPERMERQF